MLISERRTFITPRGYRYSFIYVPARDSKTTLLFLHGFPSQADDWERQIAHFAPLGYGVIAPDLLGYGDTSKPDALTSYTFKGMSDDIAQLLDHLKVEFVVGVGHDFGANFLGRLAAYHPARFQALVFLAVGSGKPAQKFDVEAIHQMTKKMTGFVMFGYLSWLGGKEDPHGVLEEHARSAMSLLFAADNSAWRTWLHPLGAMKQFVTEDKQIPVGEWYTSAMQDRHLEVFGAKDGYKGATRWYRMLVTNASLEEEKSIAETSLKQPSIIVTDAQSMPPQMGMLAEWVPNLTLKELESGHWTHIECAEQVNRIITEHIEALGARELVRPEIAAYFPIDPNASTGDFITTQRPAMEQMDVDEERAHPEAQDDAPWLERPPTSPQDISEPMDVDSDNSEVPMDVDEGILENWRQGQFGNVRCAVAIAALAALSNNKFGRSLSELILRASNQEEDCHRDREMAKKTPNQSLPSCSQVNKLEIGFQLADRNWAGTYDSISVAFASEKDEKNKNGQHQRLQIADAPSAGLYVWKPVDVKKFFGSSYVALKDIRYVGLYDWSAGLGISGDRWEFQGLKLRGQCVGKNKQVEVDKFASVNKYLQHSNKNKGNPWIFQMPFFPKVDDGHRGTVELVWAGNMTVNDWKTTGAKGEKETAQFCFSEGGSEECNEGSDKDKYTKGPAQAS